MSNYPKYVFDTNIIVSALLFRNSQPRQALDKARKSAILLISQAVREEIKDNKILDLAVCGEATAIITGDQDLLILNPFQKIAILTVKQFLE